MSTQFIILLIFGGISVLSWMVGKLREQAELKRARDDARRRRDEELRTGRAAEGAPAAGTRQTAAQTRAQELAARRQAQLEQLRRQQQARAQVTLPGGVVIVRTPPAPQAPTAPTRAPGTPRRAPMLPGPTGIPVPPRRAPARPMPPARSAPAPAPAPITRPAAPAPMTVSTAGDPNYGRRVRPSRASEPSVRDLLRLPDGRARSGGNLRALFGALEVLGPPVALRRDDRLF